MHRRVAALASVVMLVPGLAGCGSEDNGGTVAEAPATAVKRIQVKTMNIAFDPTAIQLSAGDDVQFVIANGDQIEHNLTVEGLGVNQDVEGGKTVEAEPTTPVKAGTYQYHCEYHPDQMKGTVTVT